MREKYRSPGLWGATAFAVTLGASIGMGGWVGAKFDASDPADIKKAEASVNAQNGSVEEGQRNLVRVQQNMGEACFSLVMAYLPGGQLPGTPEDTAVSDIMNDPDAPCGNTLTKIRIAYRNAANAQGALSKAEEARYRADTSLEHALGDAKDSSVPNGRIAGGLAGAFGGMLVGFWAGIAIDETNPRERRRY